MFRKNLNVICKKSLFKSTYKRNAFTNNKKYKIDSEDEKFYYIIDNESNQFNFSKKNDEVDYYKFEEYFDFTK